MKVTAFVGSSRKKHTYNATEKFLKNLQSFGDIEYEIVMLDECNLQVCKGCKLCFDKGEELCPLKDDRDILIDKMKNSDGVVFGTPNYSFQVSALMKIYLDRLGFFFHRPYFFGKAYTCIVSQGIYGGNGIVKYLNFVGSGLGFNLVKGECITSLEPLTEKAKRKNDRVIEDLGRRYYSCLVKKEYPTPSLFKLMIFRMSRTSMKVMLNDDYRDYVYYNEKGWFNSDYYYRVRLNPFKKILGKTFDLLAERMGKNQN